jgi:hypothetical protein
MFQDMFPVEVQIGTKSKEFVSWLRQLFIGYTQFPFSAGLARPDTYLTLTNQMMPQMVVHRTTNIVDVVWRSYICMIDLCRDL